MSSQYQLFKEYPYNYQKVLENYLKSTFCHMITSNYGRKNDKGEEMEKKNLEQVFLGTIFGPKPEEETENKGENRKKLRRLKIE